MPKLWTVGLVLGPVLIVGPGLELKRVKMMMLEAEMEAEAEQGNKHSALHPWRGSVVRRKTGQGILITRRNRLVIIHTFRI